MRNQLRNHPFYRDLWLKDNKHPPSSLEKKWVRYFSSSCARVTGLTQRWTFCFHTKLSLTSLYLLCCDPGAGSSSRTSTLRAGYCGPESISAPLPLIYTCLFLQSLYSLFLCPLFYDLSPSSLHFQSQNLLFVFVFFIAERHALVSPHTGIAGRVLPVGDWSEQVSGEVLRLMLSGSFKSVIISTAWIETREQSITSACRRFQTSIWFQNSYAVSCGVFIKLQVLSP